MKKEFWLLPVFIMISAIHAAFAEYRTPDYGTTYTLPFLFSLSAGAIESTPSGFVVRQNAISLVRENTFEDNATNPPRNPGDLVLSAIFIHEQAQPNLGTKTKPGLNVFRNNDPLCLYYAGQKNNLCPGERLGEIHGTRSGVPDLS